MFVFSVQLKERKRRAALDSHSSHLTRSSDKILVSAEGDVKHSNEEKGKAEANHCSITSSCEVHLLQLLRSLYCTRVLLHLSTLSLKLGALAVFKFLRKILKTLLSDWKIHIFIFSERHFATKQLPP